MKRIILKNKKYIVAKFIIPVIIWLIIEIICLYHNELNAVFASFFVGFPNLGVTLKPFLSDYERLRKDDENRILFKTDIDVQLDLCRTESEVEHQEERLKKHMKGLRERGKK